MVASGWRDVHTSPRSSGAAVVRPRTSGVLHAHAEFWLTPRRLLTSGDELAQEDRAAIRYGKRERIYQGTIDVVSTRIRLRDPVN